MFFSSFFFSFWNRIGNAFAMHKGRIGLKIDNGLSDGEVSLHGPREIENLGRYEFEHLVHVYVVRCT